MFSYRGDTSSHHGRQNDVAISAIAVMQSSKFFGDIESISITNAFNLTKPRRNVSFSSMNKVARVTQFDVVMVKVVLRCKRLPEPNASAG